MTLKNLNLFWCFAGIKWELLDITVKLELSTSFKKSFSMTKSGISFLGLFFFSTPSTDKSQQYTPRMICHSSKTTANYLGAQCLFPSSLLFPPSLSLPETIPPHLPQGCSTSKYSTPFVLINLKQMLFCLYHACQPRCD